MHQDHEKDVKSPRVFRCVAASRGSVPRVDESV